MSLIDRPGRPYDSPEGEEFFGPGETFSISDMQAAVDAIRARRMADGRNEYLSGREIFWLDRELSGIHIEPPTPEEEIEVDSWRN